jgi:hypothetical protein
LFTLEDRTLPGEAALGPLVTACLLLPTYDPVAPVENWLGTICPADPAGPESIAIFHGPAQPSGASPEPAPAEDFLAFLPFRETFVAANPPTAPAWFDATTADRAPPGHRPD